MAELEPDTIFITDSEDEEPVYTEDEESDYDPDDDLDDIQEDIFDLSIQKKSSVGTAHKELDVEGEDDSDDIEIEKDRGVDEKSFENVQKIIEAGWIGKLKVDQCKVYLRKNGLRLTGNKDTLIQRIKEHQEILNGGGEKKYPTSSFLMDCKGDACTGDVVMFTQNVYEMFDIASRSSKGTSCGKRVVAGKIVKESYGAAKQQHTFTIEVLWSRGEKPLPPLHPLLIKGRNLYRLNTTRQRWEDEGERSRVLKEKHSRGGAARSERQSRIQDKGRRQKHRAKKPLLDTSADAATVRIQNQESNPGCKLTQAQCSRPAAIRPFFLPLPPQPFIHQPFSYPPHQFTNWYQPIETHRNMSMLPIRQPLQNVNGRCQTFRPLLPSRGQAAHHKKPCREFAHGHCRFGDRCIFSHSS